MELNGLLIFSLPVSAQNVNSFLKIIKYNTYNMDNDNIQTLINDNDTFIVI